MIDQLLRCETWIRIEGLITEVCRCVLVREHGHTAHKFAVPGDVYDKTQPLMKVHITTLDDPRDPA